MQTLGLDRVRYALLRDGERWLPGVAFDGLEVEPEGHAELRRLPGLAIPSIADAAQVPPSGLALDRVCGLYVAYTSGNVVLRVGLDCGQDLSLGAGAASSSAAPQLSSPAGLCLGPFDWLFVADAGSGRVLVYTTPGLELRDAWSAGLVRPVGVAASAGAVFVLDAGTGQVRRFDAWGNPDARFDAGLVPPAGAGPAQAIAAGDDGTLYVAYRDLPGVFLHGGAGAQAGPPMGGGLRAQALAVAAGVLYAADITSGEIRLYSLPGGGFLGAVAGFRGPVSALAVDPAGKVYVKTGLDPAYLVAPAGAARRAQGTLQAGPLDAGVDRSWHRAAVEADSPAGTSVELGVFSSDSETAPPVWTATAFPDSLLGAGRYLWLQVTLRSLDGVSTPRLAQVEAETPGDSYLSYLPAIYGRNPETSDFLERLLDLARSLLGDLESTIAGLARHFRAATSPGPELPWLASWQAFEVPATLAAGDQPDSLRTLVDELPELYASRGTAAGVRRYVEIYTGTRPHLFEDFRGRGVWVLGSASVLGFDTGMASAGLEDLVVDQDLIGTGPLGPYPGLGRAMFETAAHRFTVVVPAAAAPTEEARLRVRRVLDQQKPAHTAYHICFAEPRMRIGIQARVGIDAIVAAGAPVLALDEGGALDRGSRLAPDPESAPGAVERRARIGIDTRLG